jgi:multidrug efflux pump
VISATLNVLDEIKRVKGVGDANIFGAEITPCVFGLNQIVWHNFGVTTSDIATAIQSQNAQYAAGKIGQEPSVTDQQLVYTVNAKGRLLDPNEFGNIIVRAGGS